MKSIYPVILCGGNGNRLWPISNDKKPKPFLKLIENKTLFQETIARLNLPFLKPPVIVCQDRHFDLVTEQIKEFLFPYTSIIKEKSPKNTLIATLLALQYIKEIDEKAGVIVFPSDHYFEDPHEVLKSIKFSVENYEKDTLVVFGHEMDSPHVGYGYIKPRSNSRESSVLISVDHFQEKPSVEMAKKYFESGDYLWNMGIFLSSIEYLLEAAEQHCCIYYNATKIAIKNSFFREQNKEISINSASLDGIIGISMDKALIEKMTNLKVCIVENSGWKDLGTWSSLSQLPHNKKENGNIVKGNHITLNSCENCFVLNESKKIKINIIGLKNANIVSSEEGILIESNCQTIKNDNIYQEKRPWGMFNILDQGKNYLIKKIVINPLCKLSLQKHQYRSEKWIFTEGTALVTKGDVTFVAVAGDTVDIEQGEIHRIENHTDSLCSLVEIQRGYILEESDIIRIEDFYGRQ